MSKIEIPYQFKCESCRCMMHYDQCYQTIYTSYNDYEGHKCNCTTTIDIKILSIKFIDLLEDYLELKTKLSNLR